MLVLRNSCKQGLTSSLRGIYDGGVRTRPWACAVCLYTMAHMSSAPQGAGQVPDTARASEEAAGRSLARCIQQDWIKANIHSKARRADNTPFLSGRYVYCSVLHALAPSSDAQTSLNIVNNGLK